MPDWHHIFTIMTIDASHGCECFVYSPSKGVMHAFAYADGRFDHPTTQELVGEDATHWTAYKAGQKPKPPEKDFQ